MNKLTEFDDIEEINQISCGVDQERWDTSVNGEIPYFQSYVPFIDVKELSRYARIDTKRIL